MVSSRILLSILVLLCASCSEAWLSVPTLVHRDGRRCNPDFSQRGVAAAGMRHHSRVGVNRIVCRSASTSAGPTIWVAILTFLVVCYQRNILVFERYGLARSAGELYCQPTCPPCDDTGIARGKTFHHRHLDCPAHLPSTRWSRAQSFGERWRSRLPSRRAQTGGSPGLPSRALSEARH